MRGHLRFCLTGLPLVFLPLVLAACLGAPADRSSPSVPSDVPVNPKAGASTSASLAPPGSGASSPAAIWPGGIELAFGQRYASAAGGYGWIVSKPFGLVTLTMTSLSLADGATATTPISGQFPDLTEAAGVAPDDMGQVWLVYQGQIVRIDEQRGTTHRWNLPPPQPDAAPSDANPAAGQAVDDTWDAANSRLVFVRNGDHRLYRFDPATSSVSSTDLPITTTVLSRVSVAADGSVAVSGSRPGTTTPATALLAARRKPVALANVVAACGVPSGMATLDATGAVRVPATAPVPLGQTGFAPGADALFACDRSGNVFSAVTVGGILLVVRIGPGRQRFSENLPLAPVEGEPTESPSASASAGAVASTGTAVSPSAAAAASPSPEFADPLLQALLPDGDGGVWLVSADGSKVGDSRAGYPSLLRVRF